ncbi:hypothetical protein F4703DRAFT_1494358 [Phycomyces blakesleeanus]
MALIDYDDDEIPITLSAWGDQSAQKPSWESLKDPNLSVTAGQIGSGGLHRRGRNFIPVSEDHILRQRLKGGPPKKSSNATSKTMSSAANAPKPKKTFPQSTTFSRPKPNSKSYSEPPRPSSTQRPPPSTTRPPPPNSTWNTQSLVDVPFWEKKPEPASSTLITPITTPPSRARYPSQNSSSNGWNQQDRPSQNSSSNGWNQQDYPSQNSNSNGWGLQDYSQQNKHQQPQIQEQKNNYQQQNYQQQSYQQQTIYEQQQQQHALLNQPPKPLQNQTNQLSGRKENTSPGRPDWLPNLPTAKPAWVDQPMTEAKKPSWIKETSWTPNRGSAPQTNYRPNNSDNRNFNANNPRSPPGLSKPPSHNLAENNPVIITISIELESGIMASVSVRLLDDPAKLSREFGVRHNITDPVVLNALLSLFIRQKETTLQKRNYL